MRQRGFKGNVIATEASANQLGLWELGTFLRVAEMEARRLGLCMSHQTVVMEALSRGEACLGLGISLCLGAIPGRNSSSSPQQPAIPEAGN